MENSWMIVVIVVASLIKGITGFGFALVALPLLLLQHSTHEIIPVLTLCNWVVSIIIVLQKKDRQLVCRPYKQLIASGALFTLLGVALLKYLPEHLLLLILAITFLILSVISFFKDKQTHHISLPTYGATGAVCGILAGSTSISGPPLALFLNYAKADNQQFREIFSWFGIVTSTIALIGYAWVGLLNMQSLKMTMTFLPILYLGSFVGKRINHYLPVTTFRHFNLALTILSCLFMLLKH